MVNVRRSVAQTNPKNTKAHFFVLEFAQSDGSSKEDTLWVSAQSSEYALIWKSDTICSEWSYTSAHEFISSLGALGAKNTFLLQTYQGDGCPTAYRILAFKNEKEYFLSDTFGNCEEVSTVRVQWPEILFRFRANSTAHRKAQAFVYNQKGFTLKTGK